MPKANLKLVRNIILTVVLGTSLFFGGYYFGYKGFLVSYNSYPNVTISRITPPDKKDFDFSLFWKVWDTMLAKYYDQDKLIPAKMVYGAISGMVSSAGDPYTIFLEPSQNQIIEEDLSGSFEGVGIQIGYKDKALAVIAPLPDTPAEKAGVRAGDYILNIKDNTKGIDQETSGMTIPEAVSIIRGRAGTAVILTLFREGEDDTREVTVVRGSIDVPSVTVEYPKDSPHVAILKVVKFSGDTTDEWNQSVTDILKHPEVNSVILDLRNNPGGYLEAAVDLTSEFVDIGTVGVIQEHNKDKRIEFKTERVGLLRNYKGLILVNEGSASASEILAGALRDQREFKIVGDKSFGKGTIQEPVTIDNGAGLHITIAKWLTPKGIWVNEAGLTPDVEISDNPDTDEDEQLQEALRIVGSSE